MPFRKEIEKALDSTRALVQREVAAKPPELPSRVLLLVVCHV
jgi:hypothetical protein